MRYAINVNSHEEYDFLHSILTEDLNIKCDEYWDSAELEHWVGDFKDYYIIVSSSDFHLMGDTNVICDIDEIYETIEQFLIEKTQFTADY